MSDDITAEFAPAALATPQVLHTRLRATVAAKTDIGRARENNEDKHEFYIPEADAELASRGSVFVVADGMGGHEAGQIASELAVKTFIDVYRTHPGESVETAARSAVAAANRFVLDSARATPSRRGMGCTLTVLMLVQDAAWIAHAGDSRIYRLRDGELSQLTRDHTWVEEVVGLGMMSREAAELHHNRHMILRAVGADADIVPDVFEVDLLEGDKFLLCSDGVTNHVDDQEIAAQLSLAPSAAAWGLVQKALAGGGLDNATAMVVRVDSIEAV